MSEEEYNNRIGKINAEISTDRVGADREHYLLLQKLYLKDRYIEGLQQKVEQLENIRKEAIKWVKLMGKYENGSCTRNFKLMSADFNYLLNILNKGSEKDVKKDNTNSN